MTSKHIEVSLKTRIHSLMHIMQLISDSSLIYSFPHHSSHPRLDPGSSSRYHTEWNVLPSFALVRLLGLAGLLLGARRERMCRVGAQAGLLLIAGFLCVFLRRRTALFIDVRSGSALLSSGLFGGAGRLTALVGSGHFDL